jgi:hypothetical protein
MGSLPVIFLKALLNVTEFSKPAAKASSFPLPEA